MPFCSTAWWLMRCFLAETPGTTVALLFFQRPRRRQWTSLSRTAPAGGCCCYLFHRDQRYDTYSTDKLQYHITRISYPKFWGPHFWELAVLFSICMYQNYLFIMVDTCMSVFSCIICTCGIMTLTDAAPSTHVLFVGCQEMDFSQAGQFAPTYSILIYFDVGYS